MESLSIIVTAAPAGDAETLLREGLRLAEQGRPAEAIPLLQQAVQAQSDSARAHHNLGVALAQLGRHDEAVAALEQVSLQKEHGLEQVTEARRRFPLTVLEGLDESGGAFVDTAAVMQNLDLVVTADTAAAHVAGALGVPVWLALSRAPDWRWGLAGETTPWYPTMRLFRQSQLGDWLCVFEGMAARLRREARKKIA